LGLSKGPASVGHSLWRRAEERNVGVRFESAKVELALEKLKVHQKVDHFFSRHLAGFEVVVGRSEVVVEAVEIITARFFSGIGARPKTAVLKKEQAKA
jgi:hypothetical protein